ncbi:MAG: alpha/beta fold hydrolase, partial [Acidobacteriota bacterium]
MHQTSSSDPWIAFRQNRPQARLRLLCFPYAGGGALTYRKWTTEMPPEIDVLPVQLPGRERRLREAPHTSMAALIDDMVGALERYVDQPFAIFGHSMGSIVGYEAARRLQQDRGVEPIRFLASARRAPQLPNDREGDYLLPDQELCERLREMNGTPTEVLDNPELMQLMLPLIRADFELNETYTPAPEPRLSCPVTALG